jgi:FtsZ-binding cell division protein ZapB
MVKYAVRKAFRSVPGLVQEVQEPIEAQVVKLVDTIQKFQARIVELEARTVLSTPQEVRDQRESAKNTVASIKSLTSACKQLSDKRTEMYECLVEDPELKKLEAQLQEPQQQEFSLQAQMILLTVVERMKRSQV